MMYDPNDVDGDLVVECWISQGPRASDSSFDPQPGDQLLAGDEEEPPLPAVVIRRDGDRVWARIELPAELTGTSQLPASAIG
ncbi:MAG: hypothetical protein ACRD2W_00120 [Acidimicrobiales bacterium]